MMMPVLDNLAHIDRDNVRLNVFVERAPAVTTANNGALAGFGIAIKSNIAVAGMAHTAGIEAFRHRIANHDATVVRLLRDAGATILGTVNMEEAALGATTNNPHFGRTENPLRAGFTPGGSSGGSAAAVAANMARAALGTDTMGSCRIPAAYCGVVGFKPSFGRLSVDGVEPLSRRLDHVGVLAHSVADVHGIFSALAVFDEGCADSIWFKALPAEGVSAKRKRLAVLDANAIGALSEPVRVAYLSALNALDTLKSATGAGFEPRFELVERVVDLAALSSARRAGLLICEAELASTLSAALEKEGGISPFLRDMIAYGAQKSAPQLAQCHAKLDDTVLILREQLAGVDAIFWPTAPQTAFAFSDVIPANQADFTCLANFTGAPAISLPARVGAHDLPVGLQLIAPVGCDVELLLLAAEVEALLMNQ